MHSLALILFLAVADSPKSTVIQPATPSLFDSIPMAAQVRPYRRVPWGGDMRLLLIRGPKEKAKKMTCDFSCSQYCWQEDSECMLNGGTGEQCLVVYQNCICQNHCCTPEDEPAYCQ